MVIDVEATAAAGFLDPLSYKKRSKSGEILQFLFGLDMAALRHSVFLRSKGFCESPVNGFKGHRCGRNITEETGELHHSPTRAQGGDDSLESTLFICRRCHCAAHGRVTRWSNRVSA